MEPPRLLYPLRTYLVTSGKGGESNVMAADWVTIASWEPFIVVVSISPKRYTSRLVASYGELVIGVPSCDLINDVWIAGSRSGPKKLSETKLKLTPSSRVNAPSIGNALANLECKVIDSRTYGDHTLFIAEVVSYNYRAEAYPSGKPSLKAEFLAHIARNEFTTFKPEVLKPTIL
ncbi:MAG: flavin reductase family protein [Sulfolobales archaeon]|nr:flavin reductase family protein [Sulfolobales archaeon]MCX8198891.1 flavin reductase family protein [Sulfolobales archaeon]MDW8170810.1 flavin reductase family protein [Desulfurococcaceae archaeon]